MSGSVGSISSAVGQLSVSGEKSTSLPRSPEPSENEIARAEHSLSSLESINSLASSATLVFSPKCYSVSVVECADSSQNVIEDICSSIRAFGQDPDPLAKGQSLGVLRAVEGSGYDLQSPRPVGDVDSRSIVGLDDLFTGDQCRLARRHRISLALRLAWAVIQLHQTPWIRPKWSWNDFSAISNRQQGHVDDSLFITKHFASSRNPNPPRAINGETDSPLLRIALGEPVLARLGYALIELASGKRLASLREATAPASDDKDLQDLLTARHLLDTGAVIDEECQAYSDVVHVCLYQQIQREGGMGLKKLKPQDASFERDLTQAVVQPLYNLYSRSWEAPTVTVTAF